MIDTFSNVLPEKKVGASENNILPVSQIREQTEEMICEYLSGKSQNGDSWTCEDYIMILETLGFGELAADYRKNLGEKLFMVPGQTEGL